MKKLVFAFVGLLAGLVQVFAHTVTCVEAGGTYSLGQSDAQNAYATSGAHSQLIFAGDGMLKLPGSGGRADVKTTLVATNGTLTIDVSEFTFSSETYRALRLGGGIDCGTAGKLKIVGANKITIGDARESGAVNMPVRLPEIEIPEGATLSFAKIAAWKLPNRKQVPWTIDDTANQLLYADDIFSDLADETGTVVWRNASETKISIGSPVGTGTLDVGPKQITIYPAYNPTTTVGGNTIYRYLDQWGGSLTCASHLRAATVNCGTRDATLTGSVLCTNLLLNVTANGSKKGAYVFNGPVEAAQSIQVSHQVKVGQQITFNDVCFTNGTILQCSATNAVLKFTKATTEVSRPRVTDAQFAEEQAVYNWHSALEIGTGVTVEINSVSQGTGILRGKGTVRLGRITGTGKLLVEDGLTVVKDTSITNGSYCMRVDETRIEGKTYTTYFAANGTNGELDLSTFEGSGTISVPSGTTIYGATNGTPQVTVNVAGTDVALRAVGDTWRDDTRITHWFDFSNLSTMSQVEATENPPTRNQGTTTVLSGDELGPKSVTLTLVDQTACAYPAVETFRDCRGDEFTNELYNNRMYQNSSKGYNEWWNNVYMVAVTNDQTVGRSYLSSGNGRGARRLSFTPSLSNPKSITLVFGSQFGGGSGLFADKGVVFGRKRTLDDSILTNDTCDVWVDGVKVDPTTAKFSGGWQVITVQPKKNVTLYGIGYSTAFTGSTADGGCQNYGEIVVYNNTRPTEVERIALEKYLADKWGITYNVPVPEANLTGTGAATVSGDYVIGGDFAGTLTLADTAEVRLTGDVTDVTIDGTGELVVTNNVALPQFAETFAGLVNIGADYPWFFHVNPTEGTVADALNFGAGRVILPGGTIPVSFDVTGLFDPTNALTLVSAGALVGQPTWQAVVEETLVPKLGTVLFDQTETGLSVTLPPKRGCLIIIK